MRRKVVLGALLAWGLASAQGPATAPTSTRLPTATSTSTAASTSTPTSTSTPPAPKPAAPGPSAAAQRKAQQGEEATLAGEWRTALFVWQEAANLAPAHAPFRLKLGEVYERLTFWDEAVRQYELAAALDPPGTAALKRAERARALRDGKMPAPEPAAPAPPTPTTDTPGAAAYEAGVAFIARGQYGEALASLDEAVRRDPRLSVAYTARASALFGLARYVEAAGDYRTSLALDPSQATPLFGLGECYRLLGQREGAAEHYARYLQSSSADVREDLKAEAQRRVGELRP
ncbi:MAG: tetratricopeptide repeat protein [Deltaproteobacteria bacterium]|nr:tetratricopeptide repeat protein [Deltaproteobacteria bacterium]